MRQTWEESDLLEQLDHEFFFPVFQFDRTDTKNVGRKELVFRGALFWYVPDDDMEVIRDAWDDVRKAIDEEDFDMMVHMSDRRIVHVRPHARDADDTYPFRGRNLVKKSFWLNKDYIESIIDGNLEPLS